MNLLNWNLRARGRFKSNWFSLFTLHPFVFYQLIYLEFDAGFDAETLAPPWHQSLGPWHSPIRPKLLSELGSTTTTTTKPLEELLCHCVTAQGWLQEAWWLCSASCIPCSPLLGWWVWALFGLILLLCCLLLFQQTNQIRFYLFHYSTAV